MDTRLSAMRIELKALSTESSDVFGKQLQAMQAELKAMVTESHEVQNKQLDALKKDTEAQLHDICSMFEEFGGLIKANDQRLQGLTAIESKMEELDQSAKETLAQAQSAVNKIKTKTEELSRSCELQGDKVAQIQAVTQTHENLLCKLE